MSDRTRKVPLPGSTRAPVVRAKLEGKADAERLIKVSIYAKPRMSPAAAQARAARGDALLPGKRRYLTRAQFDEAFGANPADLKKIADWATGNKLKVLETSVPKRLVLVEGLVRQFEEAFGIQLYVYSDAQGGGFRARHGDIHVPADLAGIIDGVFGLDTRKVGRPRLRRSRDASLPIEAALRETRSRDAHRSRAFAKTRGAFFPPQLAALYNYPPHLDGTGQNVAVFAFNGAPDGDPHGGYRLDALELYFEQVLGGVTPVITDVRVHGPGNEPGPDTKASDDAGDSTGEVMLDMCVVGALAPGAKMFVYFTEFTSQGWVDALHQAITDDNDISVISISYGNPEDDPDGAWTRMGLNVVNQAFAMAAARGITICCAAGDDGSSDAVAHGGAHVDFPASSPHVLGVGGTKLVARIGPPLRIVREVVWNEERIDEGSTGGGVSAVFTRPDYQGAAGVPPSVNPPHVIGRGVPDVSAVADPETGVEVMHVNGRHLDAIGGTSASAPLWAALVARLNQGLKARCGFLNTVLYTKCAKGVLRDITSGNNGAYAAGRGWDACTGLGSPDGVKLFKALGGKTRAARGRAKKRAAKAG